jgi:hypothetical protein
MQIWEFPVPVPTGTTASTQARQQVKVLVLGLNGFFSDQKITSFQTSRGSRMIRSSGYGKKKHESRERTDHQGRVNNAYLMKVSK